MSDPYNYDVFDMKRDLQPFPEFSKRLHVGERAPDFRLEDLETGDAVRMKDLWAKAPAILEFGSFT